MNNWPPPEMKAVRTGPSVPSSSAMPASLSGGSASGGGASPREARARAQLAKVRATSLETAYTNLTSNNLASTNLRVITPADTASSNRRSSIEMLAVLGGVAGLMVGLALSWLISSWTWRRKRR